MDNFDYFALNYLNDWVSSDLSFVTGLASESAEMRRSTLHRAAKYYRITRNFKKLASEARLDSALNILDDYSIPLTAENVADQVSEVAEKFRSAYGKTAVSAASKLLWIKHRSPVVLYDSRAITCLKKKTGYIHKTHDYFGYRAAWLKLYAYYEKSISLACTKLPNVSEYSLAYSMSKAEVAALVNDDWFKERVFDKFLWVNA